MKNKEFSVIIQHQVLKPPTPSVEKNIEVYDNN